MVTRLIKLAGIGLCLSSAVTYANVENETLVTICGKPHIGVKQEVTIEPATRVSLLQGNMLRVESYGFLPSEQVIAAEVNKLGIPKECAEYLVSQGSLNELNGRVYFNFDSDELTSASIAVLDSLLTKIQSSPQNIELQGHTDSIGSKGYNFSLGLKRAESVQEYLVENDIDERKIKTTSFGENKPVASNQDSKGREKNRRVEITAL
ncbi:OmpA family protein [Vibrio renipiscarius]|uniref:Membrane protein n=1 Tax=Vibrio renipiscarius TaxID=1461322 RepID=A0A0C2NHV9_9VIBR|nr:OmpA family protein [Vibrio renipiscarius]KII76007.1 membrane protein [Vibrio renipiscarius]KII79111.1 membrane protein [Vibrio renipiscarius]